MPEQKLTIAPVRKNGLKAYLNDLRIKMDINPAEYAIRTIVIGRNYVFKHIKEKIGSLV